MQSATYLMKRGEIYYARVPLPREYQSIVGRKEIWRSLKVEKYSEALQKLCAILNDLSGNIEQTIPAYTMDTETIERLSERYYALRFNELLKETTEHFEEIADWNYHRNFDAGDIDESGQPVWPDPATIKVELLRIDPRCALQPRIDKLVKERDAVEQQLINKDFHSITKKAQRVLKPELVNIPDKDINWFLCQAALRAELKALREHILAHQEGRTLELNQAEVPTLVYQRISPIQINEQENNIEVSFGELVVKYYNSPFFKGKTDRTRDKEEGCRNLLQQVFGLDTPVSTMRISFIEEKLIPVLDHLPKNWKTAYAGKSLAHILALEEKKPSKNSKFSATTRAYYVAQLHRIMSFGLRYDIDVPPHDYKHIKFNQDLSAKDRRLPIDHESINALLKHPLFLDNRSIKTEIHYYWVPLIALFTGMRMSETLFLNLDSIKNEGGIHYFDVSPNQHRRVKNKTSVRRIPVNRHLIALGFLDYVRTVRKAKLRDQRLFPYYDVIYHKNKGNKFSKGFTSLLKQTGLKKDRISFHSSRHSYEDFTKATKDFSDWDYRVAGTLAGWAQGAGARQNYGSDPSLIDLHDVANRI